MNSEIELNLNEAEFEQPLATYRIDLSCEPVDDSANSKVSIHDPVNDIGFELGRIEFALAQLFNGQRTFADISQCAKVQLRVNVSEDKLKTFQHKLVDLGILVVEGQQAGLTRDPATGITYGPLKRYFLINLIQMNPQSLLDGIYKRGAWLCSKSFFVVMMALICWAFFDLFNQWARFQQDLISVYTDSLSWLIWHYPVILTSIAIHELGHALSCRHYKVQVNDFGIGVYLLLATGWVRPVQKTWSKLTGGQRATTILMGPIASLLYAAVGILIWRWSDANTAMNSMAVVMVVASSLSLIPTLLPMFNGDTYLALTEYFEQPRLRQRSVKYCRDKVRGKASQVTTNEARLYWSVCVATLLGWVLAWWGVALMVKRIID
jgi:putative peptide zinc metalloprotease protein